MESYMALQTPTYISIDQWSGSYDFRVISVKPMHDCIRIPIQPSHVMM